MIAGNASYDEADQDPLSDSVAHSADAVKAQDDGIVAKAEQQQAEKELEVQQLQEENQMLNDENKECKQNEQTGTESIVKSQVMSAKNRTNLKVKQFPEISTLSQKSPAELSKLAVKTIKYDENCSYGLRDLEVILTDGNSAQGGCYSCCIKVDLPDQLMKIEVSFDNDETCIF